VTFKFSVTSEEEPEISHWWQWTLSWAIVFRSDLYNISR